MENITAVAVSGGIDSLMSACLLKNEGHKVIGLHFTTGYGSDRAARNINGIAQQLDIPLKIIDCATEFKSKVVDYFTKTYLSGKTPNPCMVCNQLIKFGLILSCARRAGASRLATGHYARVSEDTQGRFHLLKGVDTVKDQSYFLARLTQEQLSSAIFPLGRFTKQEVKKMALSKGLKSVTKTESQDICFIEENSYKDFLTSQAGYKSFPGPIEDISGNILGEHKGLHLFTIGQRRGINCPASKPYYVVEIDPENNRLVVAYRKSLFSSGLKATNINWILHPPEHEISVETRIRGSHDPAPSRLYPIGAGAAIIKFEQPQTAVTPGQGAVFYNGAEVMGSGWIEKTIGEEGANDGVAL